MVIQKLWLVIGIGLLALSVRLWGLGDIMTVDEERWILRSSDYYERLFDFGDTGGTFQTTHPGATGMWLMGAGIRWQEARLGYQADEDTIADFQMAAKIPIAIATSVLIGLIVWVLTGLVSRLPAGLAGILLATDPYVTGMSQIAHLDALLALLMLLSVVFFLRAAWRSESDFPVRDLLGSGVAAGLAFGTKGLPALWLGVTWGLFLVIPLIFRRRDFIVAWRQHWRRIVRIWCFTAGVAAMTLYIVWPALWVTPDLGRSVVRDYEQVVTDAHVEIELSEEPIAPISFYGRSLLGRMTPLVLIVSVGVVVALTRIVFRQQRWPVIGWLVIYAVGYVILISWAAKKGDRYAMPALTTWLVVAGFGLAAAMDFARSRIFKKRGFVEITASLVLLLLLVAQLGFWAPHAIAYNSPLFPDIRPRTQQGWGEGLELAAAWLNERPFIDRLSIASWYPSVMGVFFEGRTFSLSSREDHRVGYVVLYRNMEDRAEDDIASNVLDEFASQEPERVFEIGGVPYVWIYNVLGPYYFRSHVDEITAGVEVGQLVPVERNGWRRLDLAFATFSGRNNTEEVIIEIKEHPDDETALRTLTINGRVLPNEQWQAFDFDPIPDSAGKTYYVAVRSPKSVPGNAVTVRFAPEDVMPGQAVVRRRALEEGEKQSDFVRDGDLGYRIFYAD